MWLSGAIHQSIAGPPILDSDSTAQKKANGCCDPTGFLQTSPTSVCLRTSAVDKQPLPGPGCAGKRSHNTSCLSPAARQVAQMSPHWRFSSNKLLQPRPNHLNFRQDVPRNKCCGPPGSSPGDDRVLHQHTLVCIPLSLYPLALHWIGMDGHSHCVEL